MNKITIIIPIYNNENFLSKCLDSVVNQTYKNIEIICVNDGSTDNSLKILEKYAQEDKRIKIIDKKNEGVSVARNIGIKNATGEYLLFIDSDDSIETTTLEILNKFINKTVDIVSFNYLIENKGGTIPINDTAKLTKSSDNILNFVSPFCTKLYKRNFIVKHNIEFPQGIINHEDVIFLLKCIAYIPTMEFCPCYLYHYYQNSASVTHNFRTLNSQIAYYYWIQTAEFQMLNKTNKIKTYDLFAKLLFGCWCCLKDKKDSNKIIKDFLKDYKKYSFRNPLFLVGYRRLKLRYVYLIIKYIKNACINYIGNKNE